MKITKADEVLKMLTVVFLGIDIHLFASTKDNLWGRKSETYLCIL